MTAYLSSHRLREELVLAQRGLGMAMVVEGGSHDRAHVVSYETRVGHHHLSAVQEFRRANGYQCLFHALLEEPPV